MLSQAALRQENTANAVDLPELCTQAGYPMRKQGRTWGSSVCPDCGESSSHSNKFCVFVGRDSRWRFACNACGAHGDTADFIALDRNISLREALQEVGRIAEKGVAGWRPSARVVTGNAQKPADTQVALQRVLAKLKAHAFDTGPRAYLEGRGLSAAVIDTAINSGQLRMLPSDPAAARKMLKEVVGEDDLRAADLLKEGAKWPAIAFRPLIFLEPSAQGAEFRRIEEGRPDDPKAIRYGSMRWPWYIKRAEKPKTIMVVEGAIDMLSIIDGVPEAEAAMGIPGTNGWKPHWFQFLKERNPDALLIIGTDNDKAGVKAEAAIAKIATELGWQHLAMRPPEGQDWNDVLKARRRL